MTEVLNWDEIGKRLYEYRTENNISADELSKNSGLKTSTIYKIEGGFSFTNANNLWTIIRSQNLDPNWLLYGEKTTSVISPNKQDVPDTNLPIAVKNKKGAGIRKDENKLLADNGEYSGDLFEFIMAIEAYKKINSKFFVSNSEIFQILSDLGYRKTEKAIINPVGV